MRHHIQADRKESQKNESAQYRSKKGIQLNNTNQIDNNECVTLGVRSCFTARHSSDENSVREQRFPEEARKSLKPTIIVID